MTFSVIVASYGSEQWQRLGNERALPTAQAQEAHQVIRVHQPDGNIATCRNAGADMATGDWLIFLDADDELRQGYVRAMEVAVSRCAAERTPLLLTPAVSYVRGRRPQPARFHGECDIAKGNWMVIGTAVPRHLFHTVGGFDDRPDYGAFEDWAFWIKCVKAGAVPVKVPKAVYIAHHLTDSRHHGADPSGGGR